MKKIAYYSLLSSLLLFIMGCTLSMDEWVETEEQKGYNEVETIENDFYTLQYEYKKSTRSLTEDIQKYIVQIEADSILYFMDNTPSDWLPKAGGQVVANCCPMFPMGYMGKVLSVERQNGLVKVVTTDANLEDCFEDFDFEFAGDIYTTNPDDENQDADTIPGVRERFTRASADGQGTEIVIRDWTMYNDMMKSSGKKLTRASIDEIYDEDVDKTETKTNDAVLFEITQNGIIGDAIKDATKGFINTISLKVYYTTKTKTHKIIQLKKKREYSYTDTSSGFKFSGLIGHNFAKPKTDEKKKDLADDIFFALKESKSKYLQKLSNSVDNDSPGLTFEIPLGSLPVGIIIRIKPVLDLNIGLYGDIEGTIWTSRSITTTDVVNGKKKTDKNEKKSPPSNSYAFNAYGTLGVAGGLELFLGVGKKKLDGEAFAIGIRAQATVNLDINITPISFGDYLLGSADQALTLTGKGEVGGALLTGGWLGDIHFLTKQFTWWDGWSKAYNPRITFDIHSANAEKTDDDGKTYMEQNLSYTFTDLGMTVDPFWARKNRPMLLIYDTEDAAIDKPIEILYPTNFKSTIKTKTAYNFIYKNYRSKNVWVIPAVGNKDGISTIYKAYKQALSAMPNPTIEYDILYNYDTEKNDYIYQTVGKFVSTHPELGDIYYYEYVLPFTLRKANYIDEHWDDWGVYYNIRCPKTGFNKSRHKSLKNKITKSGNYLVKTRFNVNIDSDEFPIICDACIWYKPKGAAANLKINSSDSRQYSFEGYKINKNDKGDILLDNQLILSSNRSDEETDLSIWEGYKNINVVVE